MRIVDKKPMDTPENIFYGVDVNNKASVEQEFLRLKKRHRKITIAVVIILLILGILVFDFCRVNFFDAKPVFAIEKSVEEGTLFSGIGYKVLYCKNGERYVGSVLYKTCTEETEIDFTNYVYEKLVDYARENKLLDESKLTDFNVISYIVDGDNDEGGSDYLVNLSYTCKNDSVTCFKTDKEYYDANNVSLYVKINKYNEVYGIEYFKDTGVYYEYLVQQYTEKLKEYLINNEKLEEDNLRSFSIKLVDNNGKYKFRGITYADSYLIQVDYLCLDDGNTCVNAIDKKDNEGDFANLTFLASMFVDSEGNIALVGPREYLEL